MSSIYSVWKVKLAPAWFMLDKSAQDEHMSFRLNSLAKAGGKDLLMAISLWADEQWADWGIVEYPNVEGLIQHTQDITDHGSFEYYQLQTTLGVLADPGMKVIVPKAPIYKLAFFSPTAFGYGMSEADIAAWGEKHAEIYKEFGVQLVMQCNSGWSNGEWLWWNLEAYPSLEAVLGARMKAFETGWYKYVKATSLLGSEFQVG